MAFGTTNPTDTPAEAPADPAPDAAAPADTPAPAATAPSFALGDVVKLPAEDNAEEGAQRPVGLVVGIQAAEGDAPAIYDVAELPPASGRFFGDSLEKV
jgi:hypothetical protein